ncbi:MAG: 3,4-dihydroxy-2-butanone-4-phosphate synthase [Saprospirales bacterium]|nr:MAG: 3,4-dihydroxy-2-butanone-4-phosphate synthase [Saprospirales bacterium]
MQQSVETRGDKKFQINTIEEAIEDIKNGKIVIVVDDEDRENEGDFVCAAECITPEIINFMASHGRGLICTPIEEKRAKELQLNMMVPENTALHETAFTVSIDLIGHGCTTGISAYDRAMCIKALVDPKFGPEDFARPGHIFPLKAKSGGVLRRTGHTEAAIDLAKLAGFSPAGVLVEILNPDGSMARLPELVELAQKLNLKIVTIKDLVAYRLQNESLINKEYESEFPTKYGDFKLHAYRQVTTDDIHIALTLGSWKEHEAVMVRVHSSSHIRDILGPLRDESIVELDQAAAMIAKQGAGVLLLMRQRDEGDNFLQALQFYNDIIKGIQKPKTEQRDFGVGAQILRDLNVSKMIILTNAAKRRVGLLGYGLEIVENRPIQNS